MEGYNKQRDSSMLVILDAPPGIEFGIDCMAYQTGPNFRGVCNIPPGLHFVYHSIGMGPRQGFFLNFREGDVHVKLWDSANEEISVSNKLSEQSYNNLITAISNGELDRMLGPYPVDQYHMWINISNLITDRVMCRCDLGSDILVYPGDLLEDAPSKKFKCKSPEMAMKPYFPNLARIAKFVDISLYETKLLDKLRQNPSNTSPELTSFFLDKSSIINTIIHEYFNDYYEDLLGELQLSFILFLLLYSHVALLKWKQLIYYICQSESFLISNPSFSNIFLRILYEQLNFSPTDFFENELSKDNFLRPAMTSLFSSLNNNYNNPTVMEHRKRLYNYLQKKYGLFEESASLASCVVEDSSPLGHKSDESLLVKKAVWGPEADERCNLMIDEKPVVVLGVGSTVSLSTRKDIPCPSVMPASTSDSLRDSEYDDAIENQTTSNRAAERWMEIDKALHPFQQNLSGDRTQTIEHTYEGNVCPDATMLPMNGCDDEHGNEMDEDVMKVEPAAECVQQKEEVMTVASWDAQWTAMQLEEAKYSWRYPALYDARMNGCKGAEDLVMAAARLLEEVEENEGGQRGAARKEAKMFIEEEVSRLAGYA